MEGQSNRVRRPVQLTVEGKRVGVCPPLRFLFKRALGTANKTKSFCVQTAAIQMQPLRTSFVLRFGQGTVMKRLATLCLVLLFTRPVLAIDDGDVSYVGGTVEN